MRKKLSVIGNSLGIIIDRPILELLHSDRDTIFEVTTDGVQLVLKPVGQASRKERVRKSIDKVFKKHADTMSKLAK